MRTSFAVSANHRMTVFAGALIATALCFSLVPGGGLEWSLVQTAVLAAIALAGVLLVDRRTLSRLRLLPRGLRGWAVAVLAVGLIAGAGSLWLAGGIEGAGGAAGLAGSVVLVVATCLLTGVFEEGVFRVLAIEALAPLFGGSRGLLKAAVWSSVLFGVLHSSVGDAVAAGTAIAWAQALVKPVQAALFGFFMAALFARTRNLWVVAGVHGLFDIACLGPVMLVGGVAQPYVTGNLADLALLVLTTALLVPPAVVAFRSFRGDSPSD